MEGWRHWERVVEGRRRENNEAEKWWREWDDGVHRRQVNRKVIN